MDSGSIADISAASIAALALALTIWEARQSRKHDRLSLRPILRFDVQIVPEQPRAEIRVINKGTGFAAVSKYDLLVDGKTFKELNLHTWQDLTKFLGLDCVTSYEHFDSETIIAPGESHALISIPIGEFKPERTKIIRDAFRKLQYRIEYKSPYEEIDKVEFSGSKIYGVRE